MESVFGYNIELFNCGDSSSDCIERNITQMRQLAASNLAIVDYIEAVAPGQGMYAFQNLFSENGRVNVFLQAENVVNLADKSGFSGLTPLGADNYSVYLGSQMTLGAITHEFFHQLDRAVERGRASSVIAPGTSLSQYLDDNFVQQTQIPFNADSIYEVGVYQTPPGQSVVQVITGYVGQVEAVGSSPELLADIGMTAVLSGTGEQVQVEVSDDNFEPYEVVWASTNNAATVQDYFITLMGRVFGR